MKFVALRQWLIRKLAGDMAVMIGITVRNGDFFFKEVPTLLSGNTFHFETTETTENEMAVLRELLNRQPKAMREWE